MIRYCKSCNIEIPINRLKIVPNTMHCVNCSDVEKVSAIPIIHHKTGNEIQIVSDSKVAAEFHKIASRTGFGTLRGLKPGKSGGSTHKLNCNTTSIIESNADEKVYDALGTRVMELYDLFGKDKAMKLIRESIDSRLISRYQGSKLISIVNALSKQPEPELTDVAVSYKPKNETVKSVISDEIAETFKHWKRFK